MSSSRLFCMFSYFAGWRAKLGQCRAGRIWSPFHPLCLSFKRYLIISSTRSWRPLLIALSHLRSPPMRRPWLQNNLPRYARFLCLMWLMSHVIIVLLVVAADCHSIYSNPGLNTDLQKFRPKLNSSSNFTALAIIGLKPVSHSILCHLKGGNA